MVIPREARRHHPVRAAAIAAALAIAPDLDLLTQVHRGPTHSVGAAIVVGLVALAATRDARWALAAAAAWGSHVLLDWLGTDTWPPSGVMALWPISRRYFQAGLPLFPAVSRRYWLPGFWGDNLKAVAVEVCVLAPIAWLVIALSRPAKRER
jgi:membrane-bound metal-dependent hydrolase YbcI (DUF457 family)